jgi:hypothetical protein
LVKKYAYLWYKTHLYISNEKECNDASIKKRKDMAKIAIENNIAIINIYSTCIEDKSKPGV